MLGIRSFARMSWGRMFFLGSAFGLFCVLVFSLTPITSPLPKYTGLHEVGVLDLEVAVKPQVLHGATLKETGDKAFELSTLAVTLYYPSTIPPPSPDRKQPEARPWLPQPISLIGTGYARLAGVHFPPFQWLFTFTMWALGSRTAIPGIVDAPILAAPGTAPLLVHDKHEGESFRETLKNAAQAKMGGNFEEVEAGIEGVSQLPCVVFTHGMAGMSQSYSHYLGSIASHGYFVAAVEHRDGSGPGTIVHYPDGNDRKVWHVQLQDLESEPPMTETDLKVAQLAFREAEIRETIRLFKGLNEGVGKGFENLKPKSPQTAIPGFEQRLNLSAVTVIGHSYGATGAMQALRYAPSETMPVNGGIALDPGKASGPLNQEIDVPLLVLQSGEWTEKQTEFYGQGKHFGVVRKIVNNLKEGWFMTLTGTAHPSCTDAPLIVPWIMRLVTGTTLDAEIALREYIDVSVNFLNSLRNRSRRGVLKSAATSPNGPLGDAEERNKVEGRFGAEWEIHVVPS